MDYYRVLGLQYGASANKVKLRYRELSKAHHPDRGGSHLQMSQINEAYQILSDPIKRARYDASLRRQKLSPPPSRPNTPRPAPRPQQPVSAMPEEVIFEAPTAPQKRSRKGFWWTLIVGVTSTCFVMIGLAAMHGVSIASPDSSQAAADKPAPTLAVDPPADQPITLTGTASSDATPTAAAAPTPASQPKTTAAASRSGEQTAEDECAQKTFGFFTFTHCKSDADSVCTSAKEHERRHPACRSNR
jgi:hypothetical protein